MSERKTEYPKRELIGISGEILKDLRDILNRIRATPYKYTDLPEIAQTVVQIGTSLRKPLRDGHPTIKDDPRDQ